MLGSRLANMRHRAGALFVLWALYLVTNDVCLAQRSTNAAKETKVLLDASVDNVRAGAEQVNLAGRTIAELTSAIDSVATITAEISAAAQEQSRSIDEINQAVSLMDQSTQQNAALVEEIAAASQSLKSQRRELHSTVSFFKLD